jgi:hypothetical protein
LASIGKNIIKNSGIGYLGYLATNLSKPSKVALNRGMERAGQYLLIPDSKLANGIGAGLAIFGVIDTILSIRETGITLKLGKKGQVIAIDGSVFLYFQQLRVQQESSYRSGYWIWA